MVSMMIADGQIDDAEVETIRQVYAQLTRKERFMGHFRGMPVGF